MSDVTGVAPRAQVRREYFAARLAMQGRLRFAYIDLAPTECAANVSTEMSVADLHAGQFGSEETLPGTAPALGCGVVPGQLTNSVLHRPVVL